MTGLWFFRFRRRQRHRSHHLPSTNSRRRYTSGNHRRPQDLRGISESAAARSDSGDRLYRSQPGDARRRTVFASSWKAAIPDGTMGNERKAFYNDLPHAITVSRHGQQQQRRGTRPERLSISPSTLRILNRPFRALLCVAVFLKRSLGALSATTVSAGAGILSADVPEWPAISRIRCLQSFQASLIQMQTAEHFSAASRKKNIQTLDNAIGSAEQAIDEAGKRSRTCGPTARSTLEYLLTVAAQERGGACRSQMELTRVR